MSISILIVDDDPVVALMLENHLEIAGRRAVICADNVAVALSHIARGDIDMAIIDVMLAHGETSAPVAQALVAQGIPFLIATAGFIAAPEPVYEGRPILLKPYSLELLDRAIAGLASSRLKRPSKLVGSQLGGA